MFKSWLGILSLGLLAATALGSSTAVIFSDVWKSPDRSKTWTPPAATDTLMGRSSTDTATNKTLACSSNHITGPSGKVSQFNSSTGDLEASSMPSAYLDATSSIQTQLNAKQAAGNYFQSITGDGSATGPTGNFTLNKIQGTSVTGVTGSSGSAVVLATSPTMTNPVVGTQSDGDSSTKAASTAFVQRAVITGPSSVSLGTCTTSKTIDWSLGTNFTVTLTSGSTCAFTYSNAAGTETINIDIAQGASGGSGLASWSTTTLWSGGTAPTITVGVNKTDTCTIKYNGTDYRGSCVQDLR